MNLNCGHALRRIETALHKLELSFLMALPVKYHSLVPDGQRKIRKMLVTENKPIDRTADGLN